MTMRPIRETIPLEQALDLLLRDLIPIARTERVTLDRANQRVLAQAVTSAVDVPPFDRAAMDGASRPRCVGSTRSSPATPRRGP
jgi:molybdopterin molybdotransferase